KCCEDHVRESMKRFSTTSLVDAVLTDKLTLESMFPHRQIAEPGLRTKTIRDYSRVLSWESMEFAEALAEKLGSIGIVLEEAAEGNVMRIMDGDQDYTRATFGDLVRVVAEGATRSIVDKQASRPDVTSHSPSAPKSRH